MNFALLALVFSPIWSVATCNGRGRRRLYRPLAEAWGLGHEKPVSPCPESDLLSFSDFIRNVDAVAGVRSGWAAGITV